MKKALATILALSALAGCATAAPKYIDISSTYNPAEDAWFKAPGNNTIKASALMRQQGGGVVTCAGYEMNLFPASTYATERMTKFYGSPQRGFWRAPATMFSATGPILPDAPVEYVANTKSRPCDPQGFASFNNLPDGEYYVTAEVTWRVPNGNQYFATTDLQGGMLMQRVAVKGGETQEIVLSN